MRTRRAFAVLLLLFFAAAPASAPASGNAGQGDIHVFVALCDNVYQGIVPVSMQLGNGAQPSTNLYWGAMYGLKTHLRKQDDWTLAHTVKNPERFVLERLVFRHKSGRVHLVADAYAGRYIKECTQAFLQASAGHNPLEVGFDGSVARVGGGAGLVCFVGHNGLMDFTLRDKDIPKSADKVGDVRKKRHAAVFACQSRAYFEPLLRQAGAEALVLTNGNMAPEGYVVHALASAWAGGRGAPDGAAVREKVAAAYNKYQKCGIKGARRLFAPPAP